MMDYRTSLYTIFLKLKNEDNDFMLVHGYTGAMDVVTENVAHFLRKGALPNQDGTYPVEQETIEALLQRGYLTTKTPVQEREVVHKMANIFHKQSSISKSFLFLVAYDCNFRCPYCFENTISHDGKAWSKKVFTKDAVDRAYAAMLEIEGDRKNHRDTITLYGGEPLLAENKEVVEYIVEEGLKRHYKFMAITNGYDLEHFVDVLGPGKIDYLQITVDGPPEKHNARRTHYLHGNSFEKIMSNIMLCLGLGVRIGVRINTDLSNFDDIKVLTEMFKEYGFFNDPNFSAYSALVHGDDNDNISCNVVMTNTPSDILESVKSVETPAFEVEDAGYYDPDSQYIDFDKEEERYHQISKELSFHYDDDEANPLYEEIDRIQILNRGKYIDKYYQDIKENPANAHMVSCQDFGLRNTILGVLKKGKIMPFKSTFCSAQTSMLIFDPCGDLYTCWETVGLDKHIVGRYQEKVEFYEEELQNWYGRNISKTPACSKCKYAFFCGGGCQAHALAEGRGYNSSYCDGYPKTFQKVVPHVYQEYLDQIEAAEQEKEKEQESIQQTAEA